MEETNRRSDDFCSLYNLTKSILRIEETPKMSKGKIKCWADLASLWYNNQEKLGLDMFYTILHKIHWGLYPDGRYDEDLMELLSLAEKTLLHDERANQAWTAMREFKSAYSIIQTPHESQIQDGPGYHSIIFCCYLQKRTKSLVFPKSKWAEEACMYCRRFEAAIQRLIPESEAWTNEQWLDDRLLHQCLQDHYGESYIGKSEDFGSLIGLLMRSSAKEEEIPVKDSLTIHVLPYEIATLLWPVDTRQTLLTAFLKIGESSSRARREQLITSWLYQLVSRWFESGELNAQSAHSVKKGIYTLAIRT